MSKTRLPRAANQYDVLKEKLAMHDLNWAQTDFMEQSQAFAEKIFADVRLLSQRTTSVKPLFKLIFAIAFIVYN